MTQADRPNGHSKEVSDESLDQLLEAVFEDESAATEVDLGTPSPPERFRILRRLARGDTADVLLAHDREMDREVALKILRDDGASDETDHRRFLERAQAGAQLRHPSIVPVYGLGVGEDGRPFYAMKLVDGQPLAELIDRADRGRLLAVLEPVARAVAYAHARQVVHGDLDPSNVLVGAFGQVHLVGWIGKSAGPDGDIRALGALLETVRGQDDRLGELVRRCGTEDAPTAAEVALAVADVQRRQEARAREAEMAGARARSDAQVQRLAEAREGRRAQAARRARRRTIGVAAALLLAVALGAVGVFWKLVEDRAAAGRAGAEAASALREAERHSGAGAWSEARAWTLKAAALGAAGPRLGDLRARIEAGERQEVTDREAIRRDEALLVRIREIQAKHLPSVGEVEIARAYEEAFRESGLDARTLSPERAAADIRSRPRSDDLVAALDEWAFLPEGPIPFERAWPLEVARRADPDPWHRRLRQAVAEDRQELRGLAAEVDLRTAHPGSALLLGIALFFTGCESAAARVAGEAVRRHPADVRIRYLLETARSAPRERHGHHLLYTGEGQPGAREAAAAATAAVALRPETPRFWTRLGTELSRAGETEEGVAAYRRALALEPRDAFARPNLATALLALGRPDEALREAREAVAMDRRSAWAREALGLVLRHTGHLAEGIRELREATRLRPGSAGTWSQLADALSEAGDHEASIAASREALKRTPEDPAALHVLAWTLTRQGRFHEAEAVWRRTAELAPEVPPCGHPEHAGGRAAALCGLSFVLIQLARLDEALAAADRALAISPDLLDARAGRGSILQRLGRFEESLAEYDEAIRRCPDMAILHQGRAGSLQFLRRYEEAKSAYLRAVELDPDLVAALAPLAGLLLHFGDEEGGERALRRALALQPDAATLHGLLGNLCLQRDRLEDADTAYRKALELAPDDPWVLATVAGFRANSLDPRFRDLGQAERMARRVLEVERVRHVLIGVAWRVLGYVHYRAGRDEEAIRALEMAIRVPEQRRAGNWFLLAMAHGRLGHVEEARSWYEKAVAEGDGGELNRSLQAEAEAILKNSGKESASDREER